MSPTSAFPTSASEESSALETYEAILRDADERLPQADAAADLGDDLIGDITAQV